MGAYDNSAEAIYGVTIPEAIHYGRRAPEPQRALPIADTGMKQFRHQFLV
jgi:hypothetical protein